MPVITAQYGPCPGQGQEGTDDNARKRQGLRCPVTALGRDEAVRRHVLKRVLDEALAAALRYLGRQIWMQIPGASYSVVSDLR
jgi:hypothetical protein